MKWPSAASLRKLFMCRMKSASTGKQTSSGQKKRQRNLQETEENPGFEIVVMSTSDDEISLQLVFDDPSAISSTRDGPD